MAEGTPDFGNEDKTGVDATVSIESGDGSGNLADVGTKSGGEKAVHVITELSSTTSDAIKDFFFEVAQGNISGLSSLVVNAQNPNVQSSAETIWVVGGIYVFPTAAETLDIVSDDTADTSAGTGARTVLVEGLDGNYDEVSETVTMNGTTIVPTVNTYLRLSKVRVITSGTTETNEGTITVFQTTSGLQLGQINPDIGVTKVGVFTVPAGQTAYAVNFVAATNKNQGIEFLFKSRRIGESFVADRILESSGNPIDINLKSPTAIPEKTDILVNADTVTGTSSVSVTIEFILVDN